MYKGVLLKDSFQKSHKHLIEIAQIFKFLMLKQISINS